MSDSLRQRLHGAAAEPSQGVDLVAVEVRARSLQRRASGRLVLGAATAVAVIAVAAVVLWPGQGPAPVRVATATTATTATAAGAGRTIAQVTVRAAVKEHVRAELAAEAAAGAHGRGGMSSSAVGCKESTYRSYLIVSGTARPGTPRPAHHASMPAKTAVYVCQAEQTLQRPGAKAPLRFSILFVTAVSAYADYLLGQTSSPAVVVNIGGHGELTPTWFEELVDQPDLPVAGVTNNPPRRSPPPQPVGNSRYVVATSVEAAALTSLQCPVPSHLTARADTLPATSPQVVAAGGSTCTSVTVRFFASLAATRKSLHLDFSGHGAEPVSGAIYAVTVRGQLSLPAPRLKSDTGPPSKASHEIFEYRATNGRLLNTGL